MGGLWNDDEEGACRVEEEATADDDSLELDEIEVDEPTKETTGEDWLGYAGKETDELELPVLEAVDDGVTAGGVYTGGLLSEDTKEMLDDEEADDNELGSMLLDRNADTDTLELGV